MVTRYFCVFSSVHSPWFLLKGVIFLFLQFVHANGLEHHPDERRRVILQILPKICYRLFSSGWHGNGILISTNKLDSYLWKEMMGVYHHLLLTFPLEKVSILFWISIKMQGFFNTYWVNVNIDFCTFRCKVLFGEIIILRSFFFYIAVHLNENTKLQYIHVRGQCLVHQCWKFNLNRITVLEWTKFLVG